MVSLVKGSFLDGGSRVTFICDIKVGIENTIKNYASLVK